MSYFDDSQKWVGSFCRVGDTWFKAHLRGVFSSGPTPMFASQAIMKNGFFKIFSFWAGFTAFLSYFFLCKNSDPKIQFFSYLDFWAERVKV